MLSAPPTSFKNWEADRKSTRNKWACTIDNYQDTEAWRTEARMKQHSMSEALAWARPHCPNASPRIDRAHAAYLKSEGTEEESEKWRRYVDIVIIGLGQTMSRITSNSVLQATWAGQSQETRETSQPCVDEVWRTRRRRKTDFSPAGTRVTRSVNTTGPERGGSRITKGCRISKPKGEKSPSVVWSTGRNRSMVASS